MNDLVFRVQSSYCDNDNNTYSIIIDEKGIDDPHDTRELIIIKQDGRRRVAAFFRDKEWLVQGTIRYRHLTLYQDR
jgi:hypothetical protein